MCESALGELHASLVGGGVGWKKKMERKKKGKPPAPSTQGGLQLSVPKRRRRRMLWRGKHVRTW